MASFEAAIKDENMDWVSPVEGASRTGGQHTGVNTIFRGAVSREPMAIAADAAAMDFEWCFGTSVPLLMEIRTS